jgi:acetyl-CoA acetyltransferase
MTPTPFSLTPTPKFPEQAAIVGIGESDYSWDSGRTETQLAVAAARSALADAGLNAAELDGIMRFSLDTVTPAELARRLGVRELRLALDSPNGPVSAVSMMAAAAAALRAGQARAVLCFRSFNGRSAFRPGHLPLPETTPEGHVLVEGDRPFGGEFTGPYGIVSPACVFPLWVRAYMHRHAVSAERITRALGRIVVKQRAYAGNNPRALLRDKPLDGAGYLASPIIAEPLRKVDFCLESDGACAFIVAGPELQSRIKQKPVYYLGSVQSLLLDYDNFFLDRTELPPRQDINMFRHLLDAHAVTHGDIDVLGIYDASSANILFDLESLGFCNDGEAVEFVHGDRPAINTSGGMLAEVYLQGMNQLLEVVRQLRGDSANQIPDAKLGAVAAAAAQGAALLSGEPV